MAKVWITDICLWLWLKKILYYNFGDEISLPLKLLNLHQKADIFSKSIKNYISNPLKEARISLPEAHPALKDKVYHKMSGKFLWEPLCKILVPDYYVGS